jgi:hypothetical protein
VVGALVEQGGVVLCGSWLGETPAVENVQDMSTLFIGEAAVVAGDGPPGPREPASCAGTRSLARPRKRG